MSKLNSEPAPAPTPPESGKHLLERFRFWRDESGTWWATEIATGRKFFADVRAFDVEGDK